MAEALQAHRVTTVAVLSDFQAAIRWTTHLDRGAKLHLVRGINEHARALRAYNIDAAIHWVPGQSGICGNEEADHRANTAPEDRRYTVCERRYTSAANRAREISDGRTVAKVTSEADKCSKHYGYKLKGKVGSKRSVPMKSVKSLATMFYRLKSGHAPIETYLKRFGHREDDNHWWCGGGDSRAAQMREHLFCHPSWWTDQQKALWRAVGKATGWKADRCQQVQISELFSIELCNQVVMDILAATEIGKFPPK